jgi:tetratricopeptide (TPR) repeat protein
MPLQLRIDGPNVLRGLARDGFGSVLPDFDGKAALEVLQRWSLRYDQAVRARADDMLLPLGREMFAWLDTGGALVSWMQADPRELIVTVSSDDPAALGDALLDAPWELLANKDGFLARDMRLFTVARQAHEVAAGTAPSFRDITLLFMAAAPHGQSALDYEREESMILEATRPRLGQPAPVHLQVEESGELEFLAEALRVQGPFDVIHLSCHGSILPKSDGRDPLPVIFLEDAQSRADAVSVDRLKTALDAMPTLLFLSACRTAERGAASVPPLPSGFRKEGLAGSVHERAESSLGAVAGNGLADPFARQVSAFTPNVLGWDGSVYDSEATLFSQELYRELSRGDTVPKAAAKARRALLRAREDAPSDRVLGSHWHLARVYLGPGGGAPLCDPRRPLGRASQPEAAQAFLGGDRRVPVASRDAFVGRKRELKRIIGAYRGGTKGVVVHGMGNLGKSSLAARVAGRMSGYRTAVVYGACTERTLVQALGSVIREIADGIEDLDTSRKLLADLSEHERDIAADPAAIENALRRLFTGVLNDFPILLVLDDFEQSLNTPTAEERVIVPRAGNMPAVVALLSALERAPSRSRLMVTSRFDFEVPARDGTDLAARLERVALVPMEGHDRLKQARARARVGDQEVALAQREALFREALDVSAGNPGLQDVLSSAILNGEELAAKRALSQIRSFRESGRMPTAQMDLGDFFARMAFDEYARALSRTQSAALGAAAFFSEGVPIPTSAVQAAIRAAGVSAPEVALSRLVALGLIDDWGEMAAWPGTAKHHHFAVNPLARTLGTALSPAEIPYVAAAAVVELSACWRDDDGDFPFDQRGLEAARLAMVAPIPDPDALDAAAAAAVIFLFDKSDDAREALRLGEAALVRLEEQSHAPGSVLMAKLISASKRIGAVETQERLIRLGLGRNDLPPVNRGHFLVLSGDRAQATGDIAQALSRYEQAEGIFRDIGNRREIAITRGKIADILEAQGELGEARRIREEEELPVYEALGDRRSVAMTRGQIADILQAQGELGEARRIREEEALPVFEALGDRRSVAITRGKIADILQAQGELGEARRIREEEALPVFEALGDRREIAITRGKIADILQAQGELGEARRIREEEALPVYEALGDRRSVAVTRGQIADILQAQGELGEARRIREQEVLPVYEALGDRRSIAITRGKIADMLEAQGELGEARRIREEEELPVYEALGDRRSVAVTRGQIADILQAQGELGEARRIREEEALPVFEALGDRRSVAITRGKIADILQAQGELGEARRIREQEVLPVYEALGDRRAVAITRGKIADMLEAQGELGEARRIREEEALPVFEALGDRREIAITRGKIADMLEAQGELGEARRIREEEALPVFEALGDRREIAITRGKIADILQAQGELAEARRIREEEALPVFEALGDRRSVAMTRGQIADILHAQGELGEARRIREQEVLPVYEALGDRRSIAITRGKIADMLEAQGELGEARRIREEEELPVYEALGDRRSVAITRGQIADILQAQGELGEARRIREEEALPVFEALGDRRSVAITRGKIADILEAQGELGEARRIREQEVLPVYEALGDRRAVAITRGQIADILQAQGELGEALDMHLSRLADAQSMKDIDSLAHIRFSCAQIRLQRGDHKRGEMQTVLDELIEAFALVRQSGHADGISGTGALLGQVLAACGFKVEAVEVLELARSAFLELGAVDGVAHCEQLIAHILGKGHA